MNIRAGAFCQFLNILIFELTSDGICLRYQEVTQIKRTYRQQQRCSDIWKEKPLETHAAAKNCDNLRMTCHLGCEENDGDEDKEINEQINKIRYKRYIIMESHFSECSLVFYKAVDVF